MQCPNPKAGDGWDRTTQMFNLSFVVLDPILVRGISDVK